MGQHIVEFEQGGNARAEYGKALISNLAKDLSLLHGKRFSRSNMVYMAQRFPISQSLLTKRFDNPCKQYTAK